MPNSVHVTVLYCSYLAAKTSKVTVETGPCHSLGLEACVTNSRPPENASLLGCASGQSTDNGKMPCKRTPSNNKVFDKKQEKAFSNAEIEGSKQ